ncbi:Arc-like DNA binding domain-containing protein [Roseovarius pacificus]|uniref:Arc-like DNA binding domain-containing protein n=1 Tax=Roseovarius pacificus TaxID=337701 RepID=A0A1M7BJK1_9RHOB|nr:Arc family DNA-binding protein [Roseovarius pacificus]GGO55192.1 hypothetical protein GCM10011315_17150 [Roseovarius pacificus]SHL55103.1 Arc-like DNA binding domain-containing protein [Roseovarius pacificus]
MSAPSKQLDQFVVRLPDGMRDRIKAAAEKNGRSMNSEIVSTLEEKYPEEMFTAEDFLELLKQITTAKSLDDQIANEEMLNQTLQHLNFDFSAHIVDGAVSFIRNGK